MMIDLLNPKLIQEWAGVLALAFAGLGALLATKFVTKTELGSVTKAIDELRKSFDERDDALGDRVVASERQIEIRVAKIESDLRQLPDRKEVHALGERIGRVEKEVATSVETIRGVEKTVGKIDTTLSLILKHMLEKSP